ncbi:lysine-specific demethylase JMJ32 [Cannabis sativa]|uniref:lysine-specific demethylase JMJ32 n=1 Tax=Cannabis sativa TaxID=3483 RepID=UPI0029CA7CBD|nr:lysine-specific demethylase JMJ32 [Cannabis sativa]XP_060973409.1 lysine-specific demethylase JMJ32 [Cannabis sativa]
MEIETLWEEVRELSLGLSGEVERLNSPPTPIQFLRDFVSQNKPCIISNAINHWPALSNWSNDSYLIKSLSSSSSSDPLVSVHLTPNGRADALAPLTKANDYLCFASAHVQHMPFPEALSLISSTGSNFVAYAQQQNDCFRLEYSALSPDCDANIPWASDALGCLPEAVNLWIGNHLSETSFHKDHYENLYAVVTGRKHFLLLPPTDVHRMYIRDYPAAQYLYSQDTKDFTLELDKPLRYVPWCSVNPYPSGKNKVEEMEKFPLFFQGPKPFECTINPGEILYLPSMWFHHVRQSPDDNGRVIAVNYWYDMQFDIKYAYFNFLQSIHYPVLKNTSLKIESEDQLKTNSSEDELCAGVS